MPCENLIISNCQGSLSRSIENVGNSFDQRHTQSISQLWSFLVSYPSTGLVGNWDWFNIFILILFSFLMIESTILMCVSTSIAVVVDTEGISRLIPLSSWASRVNNFWLKNARNPWSSNNNSREKFSSLINKCSPSRPTTSIESWLGVSRPFSNAPLQRCKLSLCILYQSSDAKDQCVFVKSASPQSHVACVALCLCEDCLKLLRQSSKETHRLIT